MEERRLLLAVALSLLVLTAYSLLFPPARGPRDKPAPPPARAATPAATTAAEAPATPAPVETVEAVADERERRVEVLGPRFTIAFTNKGARLISWRLQRHRDERGDGMEMVPPHGPGPRPLDIETGEAGLDERLREALFVPSVETLRIDERGEGTLGFTFAAGEIEAEKSLVFTADGLVRVSVSVRREGRDVARWLVWGPGVGHPSEAEREVQGYQAPQGVALLSTGKVERRAAAKLPAGGETLPAARWAGVESQYFAAILIPAQGSGPAQLRAVPVAGAKDGPPETAALAAVAVSEAPALVFVGAKDHDRLSRLGHELQRVVPVGDWIGPIVVPLMRLLRGVHARIGNYGWAIVLITILINVVMAPFRHYSIANGMKMARLAPEMKTIQERYRKVPLMDPRRQQMQEEIGALYARHGMSMGTQMMVGCLPLLLTMPFLFAFYRVLTVSVDLRGAPFLWIPDLSQKDPLFLTPILMGLSMFVMQKLTPTSLDPAQRRIMMIMPIMLTGMFLWAPAGLNLYWLTSNLCAILQQGVEMRLLGGAAATAAARGGKRRA